MPQMHRARLALSMGRPCRFLVEQQATVMGTTVTTIVYEPEPLCSDPTMENPWGHELRVATFAGAGDKNDSMLSDTIATDWWTKEKGWTRIGKRVAPRRGRA